MVINMLIKSTINVVDLFFNTQKNILILSMLFSVPLVEPGQPPHQRATNKRDDNRNPPHVKSHPTIPNRFRINTRGLRLGHLGVLTFLDCGTVKVFFAVAEPQADSADMALEADRPTAWQHIKRKQTIAFGAVDRTHHY